jgi:hypothetical protein
MVATLTCSPRGCWSGRQSSSSVASGCSRAKCRTKARAVPSQQGCRPPPWARGAISPVVRRCRNGSRHAWLTPNRAARARGELRC